MDKHAFIVLKLFVAGILATNSTNMTVPVRSNVRICNETELLLRMENCGEKFKRDMLLVESQNWCNLTHFIREYHHFSQCTETDSNHVGCYWPNPLVESYIVHIHRQFFSNCSLDHMVWVDPPDDTVAILILTPVFLTLAMIALVVWCSRRSDILA